MKTSVIEVRDMLSVLSVPGVEKRMGDVPGVESVTVNYAAGNATVRYDETRLEIADIRSAVRQGEYESGHEGHRGPAAPPVVPAAKPSVPAAAAQKPAASAPAAGTSQHDKAGPSAAAKSSPDAPAAAPKPTGVNET